MASTQTTYWDMVEPYVMVGMLSLLSVMGTAGNALVIYVFNKKQDRLVSTLFIITLAVVDFITCLIIIPFTIYMEFFSYVLDYDILCKAYFFLITSNIPLSVLIMVAIAIDRYFCICHPFMHALNLSRAKIMTGAMSLFAAGLGISVAIQHGIMLQPYGNATDDGNVTLLQNVSAYDVNVTVYYVCDQYESSGVFSWYYQKCYFSVFFLCLLIVMVLYSMIYHSVHSRRSARARQRSSALPLVQQGNGETTVIERTNITTNGGGGGGGCHGGGGGGGRPTGSTRRRSTMRSADRIANLKTALMLFVVTVVFIVTYIPAVLMALQAISYVRVVFYMYFAMNVANPIIYGFMNQNFRNDLHRIFCWSAARSSLTTRRHIIQ